MDWDNDFTPWKAPGVPRGCPSFEGRATEFLTEIEENVVPEVEKHLGIDGCVERTLIGISLSGLFAHWAWIRDDMFYNVVSFRTVGGDTAKVIHVPDIHDISTEFRWVPGTHYASVYPRPNIALSVVFGVK